MRRMSCTLIPFGILSACLFVVKISEAFSGLATQTSPRRSFHVRHIETTLCVSSRGSPYKAHTNKYSTSFEEDSFSLLEDALAWNRTAAYELIETINSMREEKSSKDDTSSFLKELLRKGPDSQLPFWSRSKRLARFSRRARLASLRRTLDRTMPPLNENADQSMKKHDKEQRRLRALVALLRSLSSDMESLELKSKDPLIVRLERRAMDAVKGSAIDLRSRLPEGLETPDYDVVASSVSGKMNVEIRNYKPYAVCAVSMKQRRLENADKTDASESMPEMSGASSFGALAGYLFGKNKDSRAMKMTTPVFTSPGAEGEQQMEFVLPSNYWVELDTAPRPLADSGVTLQEKTPADRAVLMFGGYAAKKEVDRRKKELVAALSRNLEWKIVDEDFTVAQYNDPFTVPWKRLNEVSVSVAKR